MSLIDLLCLKAYYKHISKVYKIQYLGKLIMLHTSPKMFCGKVISKINLIVILGGKSTVFLTLQL